MIAHSLPHPGFGPAQNLHGATYVIDAEFFKEKLDEMNVVMDIGLAHQILNKVLQELNYQNLDNLGAFKNTLTTTEHIAYYIHQCMVQSLEGIFKGRLKVTLGESHEAWASYEAVV